MSGPTGPVPPDDQTVSGRREPGFTPRRLADLPRPDRADAAAPAGPDPEAPAPEPSASVARRRMSVAARPLERRLPNPNQMARRRRLVRGTKWLLPAGAVLLLVSIAVWPEIDRSLEAARNGVRDAARVRVESGRLIGPRYHGLDGRGQPYTITATVAQQAQPGQPGGGDRINLSAPIADLLGAGGSWIRISAEDGVFMQHSQLLDLSRDVLLYRDDGIMATGPVADMDLRRGIVASNDWVHVEGPFGVLDAQGYLLSQREGIGQFRGPARLVLNSDHVARPPAPAAATTTPPPPIPTGTPVPGTPAR